jgi:adenosine kinase
MKIFVSGSLAYDRIMDFPGRFSDHILPGKIHVLNVSFTVSSMVEKLGGTAGNIAYALSLLGEKPIILATVGRDYQKYFEWLKKNRIACDTIKVINEEVTAGAYITTDQADNQITGFNPGAMKYPSNFKFDQVNPVESIAIIAAGNLEDMITYCLTCKSRGIKYIFDPGQSLPMWHKQDLMRCIKGAAILISNDYELELIMTSTGLDRQGLLQHTKAIVTTLGEMGSQVITPEAEIAIPAVRPKKVADPTGAGDAYRAGLIKGLVQGKDIKQCATMGSVCASFAVECYGTQEYHFTLQEFKERLDKYSG